MDVMGDQFFFTAMNKDIWKLLSEMNCSETPMKENASALF